MKIKTKEDLVKLLPAKGEFTAKMLKKTTRYARQECEICPGAVTLAAAISKRLTELNCSTEVRCTWGVHTGRISIKDPDGKISIEVTTEEYINLMDLTTPTKVTFKPLILI